MNRNTIKNVAKDTAQTLKNQVKRQSQSMITRTTNIAVSNASDMLFNFCKNTLMDKAAEVILKDVDINATISVAVVEYVYKHDKNRDKHFHKGVRSNTHVLNPEQRFFVTIPGNTVLYVDNKVNNSKNISMQSNGYRSDTVTVIAFGKRVGTLFKKFLKKAEMYSKQQRSSFLVKGSSADGMGFRAERNQLKGRPLNTLFYDNKVKEKVKEHIDTAINNKEIYDRKNINWKTGILLYGEPGTGKTSLSKAIATEYGWDMVIIDMATFKDLDINSLATCLNNDTEATYLILMEDIDTLYSNLDREGDLKEEQSMVLNKMLQFLDSNISPSNVVFVATTNHYEKMDEALLRPGRFNLKVEVSSIGEETARKMVQSFNVKDVDAILRDVKYPIAQSALQEKIMSSFKVTEEFH